jgi:hypothetical protein
VSIGTGHGAAEPEQKRPQRAGREWTLVLVGLVGVYVLLAGYNLMSVSGAISARNVVSAAKTISPAVTQAPAGPASAIPPSVPAPASPASSSLAVASVAAFGPEGTADGDNPGIVSRIVDVSATQPWYSSWYATPEFGSLKSGTGILLDMGKTVTVASAELVLGATPGADVQVRVGDSPSLADLTSVVSASGAGGSVRLTVASAARGRYVLIWFTRLPPVSPGEYQIKVYDVTIDGAA